MPLLYLMLTFALVACGDDVDGTPKDDAGSIVDDEENNKNGSEDDDDDDLDEVPPEPVSLDELFDEYAALACAFHVRCGAQYYEGYIATDEAKCVAYYQNTWVDVQKNLVDEGALQYLEDAGAECFALLRDEDECGEFASKCREDMLFTGGRLEGEGCERYDSCASGLICQGGDGSTTCGVCEPQGAPNFEVGDLDVGELCVYSSPDPADVCKEELICIQSAPQTWTCQPKGLDLGEDCYGHDQCEENVAQCIPKPTDPQSKHCALIPTAGEPCAVGGGQECAMGLYCKSEGGNQICEEMMVADLDETCNYFNTRCEEGLSCRMNLDMTQRCRPLYTEPGETCGSQMECGTHAYCAVDADDPSVGVCTLYPAAGEACAPGAGMGGPQSPDYHCDFYSYCESGTCKAHAAEGEPCANDSECDHHLGCDTDESECVRRDALICG